MDAERRALQEESRALRQDLARFRTRRAWLADPAGPALAARLERHLATVRRTAPPDSLSGPARDELQVVQWNVLHGERYEAVARTLREEPALAGADLVALEETDLGMARSGNRDVAFELASMLGLHAVWTPLFLELEAGHRAPASVANLPQGEALFGLALLSRWPFGAVRAVPLESSQDLLFDRERKAGRFVALVAEVQHPHRPFTFIGTHLDVHGDPARRDRQVGEVLSAVPPGAAILAGDLNTTTFGRGGAGRAARTLLTLAVSPQRALRQVQREPLFGSLRRAGFEVDGFNAIGPSLDVHFDDVHELDRFPAALRDRLLALLRGIERRCTMRLDWIAARGFVPSPERPPLVLQAAMRGADAASDHAPIVCTLRWAAGTQGDR